MKIGIVGGGTVGRATARTWLEHCDEMRVYDRIKARETHDLITTLESDIVFICLPEGDVDGFFRNNLPPRLKGQNFVLKSTVPIGTTRRLAKQFDLPNLVHSPEFLTERCAITDAQMPARNIIGVPDSSIYNSCSVMLGNIFGKRFPGVQLILMPSDESEAVKLITNAFFATKVSFFNEMRSLMDKLGLTWDVVRNGVLSDGRIAHSHTQVPGPDGKRGWGGKCLGKDTNHLLQAFCNAGIRSVMLKATFDRNNMDRYKE